MPAKGSSNGPSKSEGFTLGGKARRDDQDRLGGVLPPSLYRAPDRLQDGRAKVADGEGVAQARMDGEDQRQMVNPGGRGPYREDGEVFAEMYVH